MHWDHNGGRGESAVRQPWKCSLLFIPPQRQLACYVQGKHNNNWFFKFPRIKTKPGCRFPEWRSDTKSCDMTSPDVFRSSMSSFSVCQWYDTPFVYLPVQTHQEKGWFWWISHTQFSSDFGISHRLLKRHTALFVRLAGRLLQKPSITFHFFKSVIRISSTKIQGFEIVLKIWVDSQKIAFFVQDMEDI